MFTDSMRPSLMEHPNQRNHSILYKTYRKYKKTTITIGICNECRTNNTELMVNKKFCSNRCYETWYNKQSQITCRGVCAYKFCDNEGAPKYNGRYCSKICRNAQINDNMARKQMLEEGLPIETADRRIKRTPVDKVNYMFGDMEQVQGRKSRTKLRERKNSVNNTNKNP